ncbi:MAG: nucleotide sugar dehydrogenase [Candidatus Methanoperedens sp.]|nr:nucleotide sugar dehydrogenase [Candidatus Methanoperedens sp.]MCZ7371214.1 nucleotide sugar dehydrogenase [Candidatus Methanoperedens sp.]
MTNNTDGSSFDVIIVGGLGHVGLPLGLAFADKGLKVCLYDLDQKKADVVRQGTMPFIEYGAEPILKKVLKKGNLEISLDINSISKARNVIIAIGTPVDEYLNPKTRIFLEFFARLKENLHKDQLIIIRSTVYPRTCQQVLNLLGGDGWNIAYCPERIVQGYAIKELKELPQIIAGLSEKAIEDAAELFSVLSPKIIRTSIEEAELVKLFSNAWRYIQFAVTNQFYMIAHNFGVDYNRVRQAMMEGYGRAATLPTAGFAAGPCLLKDTMQLSAFNTNNFLLGHAAMMINEGLPNFIVEDLSRRYDLSKTAVGILGMAYKNDIDDIRDSLSYKLGKILRFYGARVYYSDEYAKDPTFVSKEEAINLSKVLIIGVPHSAYKQLKFPPNKEIIDLWGILKKEDK